MDLDDCIIAVLCLVDEALPRERWTAAARARARTHVGRQ